MFISRLGGKTLDGNRTVSKQPFQVVYYLNLLIIEHGTEQTEDLKFKIKRAEFDTTSSGTLTLANKTLPTKL